MLQIFLFGLSLLLASSKSCSINDPRVRTPVGHFCGNKHRIESLDGAQVDEYLGIRYAAPPVGDLRFKKPIGYEYPKDNIITTQDYGKSCFQIKDSWYQEAAAARMWVPSDDLSEDCLTLNIWVPKNQSNEKLAVMVWIYGGGFNTGTSSLKVYDGKYLSAHQNIIVVSMNYRLGLFGFLYISDDTISGNMGLWDQRLAMKWVKTYIENFNGDPDRITIVGESAGAVSTNAHVLSPWSQNLFRNAIMQSGSAFNYWGFLNKNTATQASKEYLQLLNCPTDTNNQASMSCIQKKSLSEVKSVWSNVTYPYDYFSVLLGPTTSTEFLPYNSNDLNKLRFMKPSGSVMFGINKNEASYFLLYAFIHNDEFKKDRETLPVRGLKDFREKQAKVMDIVRYSEDKRKFFFDFMDIEYKDYTRNATDEYLTEILENIGSDRTFRCSTIDMARRVTNLKDVPVYFYEFRYRTKSIDMPKWLGTMHGYEIEYIFGMPFSDDFQETFYKFNKDEKLISESMMTYWGNFIRSGDPNSMPDSTHVMSTYLSKFAPTSFDNIMTTTTISTGTTSPPTYISSEPRVPIYDGEPVHSDEFSQINFKSWSEFTNISETYLVISENGYITTNSKPYKRRCAFWTDMLPIIFSDTGDYCRPEIQKNSKSVSENVFLGENILKRSSESFQLPPLRENLMIPTT